MSNDVEKHIDPNRDYNLTEIVEKGFMGEGKTYFVCKNIITDERWLSAKDRILKATRVGEGKSTNYYIRGKNLINYLKANS